MTTPLLTVEGLTKHFPVRRGILRRQVGTVQAVTDVSFALQPGETLAVVGESGCGKSTLGRAILRLHEPSAGRVRLRDTDITALDRPQLRAARRHMQIIFQDPFGSLNPRMTVRETLAEPLLLHGLATPRSVRAEVDRLIELCELSRWHAERYPHEFSGGQRQRVGIARALATRPALIVCDEPVSALDVSVQAQIVNLLQDLQRELGIAYVFISHDLGVVRHIATRVAVMYLGRIVEEAATEALFARPRHPYTRTLIASAPRPDPTAARHRVPVRGGTPSAMALPSGCAFHPRCPLAIDRCRTERPELRRVGQSRAACHLAETVEDNAISAVSADSPALLRRLAILEQARAAAT
ncbi:ABC transporter ATP-binding protein [Paracoccus siganidrum]|uniref:Dipeptide ABC transporter ATP-binding protein n=1 Tax=Paracoccus siganidrum TaxID=1276757 RepID=A0A419A8Y2_9RHOB|nr:dipeptide ABC transporter ATP-binding protein [Paracoccus siganidrum]RJL18493.1 dipeptide ABC transporter ATP-binding protein [Paracoccus siganidrum]RMC39793.1 peptide ABC transporter substrate-binding protein [Paracoccus siganidrum]